MVTHKTTYYEDFTIKTFSEISGDVLVHYEEYNSKGKLVYRKIVDKCETFFEYDRKDRLKRFKIVYEDKTFAWQKYSYTKDTMTILYRGNGKIHKTVYGPVKENGERDMITEKNSIFYLDY